MTKLLFVLFLITYFELICIVQSSFSKYTDKTVLAVLCARNKEHTLPYFLTIFENLNYPKEQISLFIRSDHNQDRTIEVLETWLSAHAGEYHSVDKILDKETTLYERDESVFNWGQERNLNIIFLKEEGLLKAWDENFDYVWFLDLDIFMVDPYILQKLIKENKPVVAPVLKTATTYSNFWCGMTEEMWYTRTEDYLPILNGDKRGCFAVPLINSCVLVDLKRNATKYLTFNPFNFEDYSGPVVDIIIFAYSAKMADVNMHVCNNGEYGYMLDPLDEGKTFEKDFEQLSEMNFKISSNHKPLVTSSIFSEFVKPLPEIDNLGFDQIYLINLVRRPERRNRMMNVLRAQGLKPKIIDAIDGQSMNANYLKSLGIEELQLTDGNIMTYGEIGNFLSHYFIWKDVVENNYQKIILFEDDIRFEQFFREDVINMMEEIKELNLEWDLIYLGRKKLREWEESQVEDSDFLVHAAYSWWTISYALTNNGAKKLLAPNPLTKLIPTDEYLPIMYDSHPKEEWKAKFQLRNLKAFGIEPRVLHPTHYTGEDGYVTDTEDSPSIEEKFFEEIKLSGIGMTLHDRENIFAKEEL